MGYRCVRDPALLGHKGKPEYQKPRGGPSRDPRITQGDSYAAGGGAARAGKRRIYVSMPVPVLRYDSNSLGPPPSTYLLVRGFSQLTTARHIQTALAPFGETETCMLALNDQMAPLGAARIQFAGRPSQAHHTAAKLLSQGFRIDGELMTVEWDENSEKFNAIIEEARRRANETIRSALDAARRREKEEVRRAQIRVNDRARRQRHIYLRHNGSFSNMDLEALLRLPVQVTNNGFVLFFDTEQDLQTAFRRIQGTWCNGVGLAKIARIRDPIERPQPPPYTQPQALEAPAPPPPLNSTSTAVTRESIREVISELKRSLQQDILKKIVMPAIVESLNPQKYQPMSIRTAIKRKPEKLSELRLHFQRKRPKLDSSSARSSETPEKTGIEDDADAEYTGIDDTAPSSAGEESLKPGRQAQQQMYDDMNAEMAAQMAAEDLVAVETPYGTVRAEIPGPVVQQQKEKFMYLSCFERLMLDEQDFEAAKKLLASSSQSSLKKPENFAAWAATYREMEHLHRQAATSLEGVDAPFLTPTWTTGLSGQSWRTRGYQPIESSKKVTYLPHRRKTDNPHQLVEVTSSGSATSAAAVPTQGNREARLTSRRQARDLNTFETDSLSFNQLLRQSKKVKFAQSSIHNWGLYASEPIGYNEMIIEYVGQVIRSPLADIRERYYCLNGIGSSYLFRVDRDMVIDATKRGNIARLINHSCTPSCIARVIKVGGEKRICIYAARPIQTGDELTYDYRFEREDDEDRIPCLCGTVNCRGYLN